MFGVAPYLINQFECHLGDFRKFDQFPLTETDFAMGVEGVQTEPVDERQKIKRRHHIEHDLAIKYCCVGLD